MPTPWHGTADWEVGQLVTAADMNAQVRDNIGHLFERPLSLIVSNRGSDFVTTSTSFVNIHSSEMGITLDMEGTRARVSFIGLFRMQTSSPGNGRVYLDIAVDGIRQAGDDGLALAMATTDGYATICLNWIITGLTPGTHLFTMQWKVTATSGSPTGTLFAGAGTATYDLHPQFCVEEF
jgi:hypothetical protein